MTTEMDRLQWLYAQGYVRDGVSDSQQQVWEEFVRGDITVSQFEAVYLLAE